MQTRYILRWSDGTYFKGMRLKGTKVAQWVKEQRLAMRFATAEDARKESRKWLSERPTVVRLVPKG